MENEDRVKPETGLVAQNYDGAPNMLGKKGGLAKLVKEKYPKAIENQYFNHSAALPCKSTMNNIDFMSNFKASTLEINGLIANSPDRNTALKDVKKNSLPDRVNANPSKAPTMTSWIVTRWTTNYNVFNCIKLNYNYLHQLFEEHNKTSVTSDGLMRVRLGAAADTLYKFQYLFLLLLSMDFFGVLDRMGAAFQEKTMTVSHLKQVAHQCIETLQRSRTDLHAETLFNLALYYQSLFPCVEYPTMENTQRRRKRRDYRSMQNYFIVDGHKSDKTDIWLRAEIGGATKKVKVSVGQNCEMHPIPGESQNYFYYSELNQCKCVVVNPFDSVKSYYKDLTFQVYDHLLGNLKDRFENRLIVDISTNLEDLILNGLNSNIEKVNDLMKGIGYENYKDEFDPMELKTEFRCISTMINVKNAENLTTLVDELKRNDIDELWLIAPNMLRVVKLLLTLMPTSASAERAFSKLGLVHTKLRNNSGDKRTSDLVVLSSSPEMVESIDLIK